MAVHDILKIIRFALYRPNPVKILSEHHEVVAYKRHKKLTMVVEFSEDKE